MAHQLKPGILEKCLQGLPDANKWFPSVLYPTGGPGIIRKCSEDDDECILLTSENWHFTWKWLKTRKWRILIDDCEGPSGRTVIYQVAEALPTGWEHFYIICDTGRRRQHLFLKNPKSRFHLVLVVLWRLASVQQWIVLEQNGKRIQKLEMQIEVSVFTACQNSPWMLRYYCLKFVSM